MRFQDALAENVPPGQIGEMRLWYEPGQLWGEQRRPRGVVRGLDVLGLVSLVLGLSGVAVLLLVSGGGGLIAGGILVALAAAALVVTTRLQLTRGRRRFVLDFTREELTLERYSAALGPARRHLVRFDDVRGLFADRLSDGRLRLLVRFRAGRRELEEELLPPVAPEEEEAFQRMWRVLQNAFGLKPPETAQAPLDDFEPGPG